MVVTYDSHYDTTFSLFKYEKIKLLNDFSKISFEHLSIRLCKFLPIEVLSKKLSKIVI